MADTVSAITAYSSNKGEYVRRLTNRSDGTGESAVAKIDVSAFTNSSGATGTKVSIDRIEYSVNGFNYVHAYWDHSSDITAAVLAGSGVNDYSYFGGFHDPGSGGTGDVTFTTDGGSDGASYDITIYFTVS